MRLEVYEEGEEEGDLFFGDLADQIIQDDVFAWLLMFPNGIVAGRQAFFTHNTVQAIAAYEREKYQNVLTRRKVEKA
jgi:hypothetical protein